MGETTKMIINEQKLKSLLKNKGIKKSYLCDELGISSRTIAKISKGEDVKDKVVSKIVDFLGAKISDLALDNTVLNILQSEKKQKITGGLYQETQIRLAYNSNRIENSPITEDQTRNIFISQKVDENLADLRLADIIKLNNHFKCFDYIIDNASAPLSFDFIISLQKTLQEGLLQEGIDKDKLSALNKLIAWYNSLKKVEEEEIVEFHAKFVQINAFANTGIIARLILFKQSLEKNLIPYYIYEQSKWLYTCGINTYDDDKSLLLETCRFAQDRYKALINHYEK